MTKKKKRALMKKGIQILEPVLREEAALVPAAGRKLLLAGQSPAPALPLKELKRAGLIAGGGLVGLTLLGNVLRAQSYRAALRRELKKQLKPINDKLDALEKENAELKKKLQGKGKAE